ncbi:MAG TPA: serine/threonine-protein kinase, partial [Kofleriaceae bacterium]
MVHPTSLPAIIEGSALGDFVVVERLGEGGHGVVYRAEQPVLGREAVIKVLHERHRDRPETIQRFLREAQLASRLDHPYAAHVYAFGAEPGGVLWIAMEYVRGTPLDRWLTTHGPMPLDRFVPFVERLCEVVHTAHEQGMVHRDIKPANVIVLERAGRLLPKLLDFGVARAIGDDAARAERTQPGHRVGTPAYMAPELWVEAHNADARTDLYAIAVLAY